MLFRVSMFICTELFWPFRLFLVLVTSDICSNKESPQQYTQWKRLNNTFLQVKSRHCCSRCMYCVVLLALPIYGCIMLHFLFRIDWICDTWKPILLTRLATNLQVLAWSILKGQWSWTITICSTMWRVSFHHPQCQVSWPWKLRQELELYKSVT